MPHVDVLFAQLQQTTTDAVKVNKNLTAFNTALQKIRDKVVETAVTTESRKRQCEIILLKLEKQKKYVTQLFCNVKKGLSVQLTWKQVSCYN